MDATERFYSKVDKIGPIPACRPDLGPCWLWTAGCFSEGYAQFWFEGKPRRGHVWIYERTVGPVPEEKQLDHLCRVRRCVNPDHLEPVIQAVNLMRGEGIPARNARKAECARGHEFTEENTYRWGPDKRWRQCKQCRRDDGRERMRRIRSVS